MSRNITFSYQHFHGYYQDTRSKVSFASFSVLLHLTNLLLYYGIIWYERFGTDNNRSVMNKLVSNICWNGFVSIPVTQVLDVVILFFGPIGENSCFLFTVFRNMMKTNVLLFLDAIIFSRYILIFWLKNPASVQDNFWSIFVAAEVVVFSSIFNISVLMLPQKHSIFYYACADLDPAIHSHLQKSRFNQAEVLLSLLIHVVILVRVKAYKEKVEVKEMSTGPGTLQVRDFLVSKLEKESLSDFATNFCLVFWACIYSLLQQSQLLQSYGSEHVPQLLVHVRLSALRGLHNWLCSCLCLLRQTQTDEKEASGRA